LKFSLSHKISLLMSFVIFAVLLVLFFYLRQNDHIDDRVLISSFPIAFFVSIVLSFLVGHWIANPIQEILHVTQAIARGDFSQRAFVAANDEIRDLANSINEINRQIQTRMNDVATNQSRLEAVFLSMFSGVMVVDRRGKIMLMNQTLRNLFAVDQDPMGKTPLEVIRNIEIQQITEEALQIKKGVVSRELSLVTLPEKILLVHATAVVHLGMNDGAVLVFHDITDLRHLEKIRRDFVANVSHELRTPVSTIKGYAETLLEGALEDKENARDFIKIIYTDAERLAKLINDILDLSRIESGNFKLDFQSCVLGSIVDQVAENLQTHAKQKKITIQKRIPSDFPMVKIDEASVTRVLSNLVENAIKYNKEGGTVTISARSLGESVEVSVVDTGMGIPEADIPRIFERFYRVDKAHSRDVDVHGTGLGLSIAKHIIQAHGGEISVESQMDFGSTFRFTLPI